MTTAKKATPVRAEFVPELFPDPEVNPVAIALEAVFDRTAAIRSVKPGWVEGDPVWDLEFLTDSKGKLVEVRRA